MVLLLTVATAIAAVPVPTAEEARALAAGEVVLRDTVGTLPDAVAVLGLTDIQAPEAAIWAALVDMEGRMAGNASLKSVVPYRPATPTEMWYRWEATRFGVSVVYHNHYVIDRAARTLLHELDTSRPNDLRASRGLFELAPVSRGYRLAYTVETDFGRSIPDFIVEWMCGSGVRTFLADIAARAERG